MASSAPINPQFKRFVSIAWIVCLLASILPSYAADMFGNGVIKVPTTASGGTGTVANLQADDDINYTVAKGATATIGGFGTHTGTINSVYLFVQYTVESSYGGNKSILVNGTATTLVPALRDYGRWGFVDITGVNISTLSITFNNSSSGGSSTGKSVLFDCVYVVVNPQTPIAPLPTWSEDFNGTGAANPAMWTYELGYQRNNELQYYMQGTSNGWQEGGNFVIEGRKEVVNGYQYTSASIITNGKYNWHYGRTQIRAQIPAKAGMWPAIWGTGNTGQWPYNGEVDILEYYQNKILANCAVGNGAQWTAKWDSSNRTMTSLTSVEPNWRTQWHIWTMQWDESNVRLYCDNVLINTIPQTWLKNTDGYNTSWGPQFPFITNGMCCWLNLAMGGAGGDPTATMDSGPQRYFIDYWKVWEGATDNVAPTDIVLSNASVLEGQSIGTVVGNLTATDADPAEVHRYTLVSGTGSTHNSQFTIPEFVSDSTTLGVVKTAAVLNYLDGPTRSIRVRVTDIEGATYDKILTIDISSLGKYVTYNGNSNTGGAIPVDANNPYSNGASVTVLNNTGSLNRTGYAFNNWNTASDGSGTSYAAGNTFAMGSSNVILYAQWTPLPTYTVSYSANSASSGSAPANQSKIQGNNLILATNSGNLAKTGYAFAGWNTAANGSGTPYAVGATYSTDAALALYAKWTPIAVLSVTPAGDLTSTGNYSGPFTPSSLQYTVTNSGAASLNWTASKTAAWLTLSSSGGTLAPGANTSVTVTINSTANSLGVNSYSDTVTFTNTTGGYGDNTRNVSLTISKASQTIAFGAISPVLDTTTSFDLSGTASSGLAVSYASSDPAVATVSGSTVTIVGLGATTITASQAGNANYNAATDVARTLTVVRANPLADPGGPYKLYVNNTLSLDGSGSFPSNGTTISSYAWDLNNDNVFGDVAGVTPAALSTATLTGTWGLAQGINTIKLKITDTSGKTSIISTTVELALALTWDANGATTGQTNGAGTWLNTGRWWDGTTNLDWIADSNVIFGGPSTNGGAVTLVSPTSVGSITFNTFNSTYTLGTAGQMLTIKNDITNNSPSGAVTFINPLTLSGNQTWTNNSSGFFTIGLTGGTAADTPIDNAGFTITSDGTGQTRVYGSLSGTGGIIKNGPGTLILGGASIPTAIAHAYSGTTTINAGTVQIQGTAGIGTGNLNITGGVLQLYNGGTFSRDLGAGIGQIRITGGVSGFSAYSTGISTISITGTDPITWGSVDFKPTEFLLLSDATAITGKLSFTSNINLNGANRTIRSDQTGGDLINGNATLSGNLTNTTGAAGLVKKGEGFIILSGTNTYNGGTTINQGALRFAKLVSMPASGTVAVANGTVLGIGLGGTGEWTNGTSGNGTLGGLLSGLGGQSGSSVSFTGNALLNIHSTTLTYSGTIPNLGTTLGLIKTNNTTLTLSGNNSFAGPVSIYQGTLSVASIGNINAGSGNLGAPTTVANGTISLGNATSSTGILKYTGTGETTNRVISLSGFNQGGSLDNSGTGTLKFTSDITVPNLGSDNRKTLTLTGSTAGVGEFAGAIIDSSAATNFTTALTKSGTGTWILSGANTYTGNTAVNAGKLFVNGSTDTTNITVATGATLGGSGSLGGNLTVNTGGKLEFDLNSSAASHDPLDLAAGKTLTFAGTCELTITSSSGAAIGQYTMVTGGNNIAGSVPATLNLPVGWAGTVSISGNSLLLNITSIGQLHHFEISSIGSPQLVGTPITGITLIAQDASNATVTNFTGTVTFGGTAGITGTSGSFTSGVLSDLALVPSNSGDNLTFTVNDGSGHSAMATFTVQSRYINWSGKTFALPFTDKAATSNPDGDDLTNLQEFAFGTDPTSPFIAPLSYVANGNLVAPGLPILENSGTAQSPAYRAVFVRRKDHATAGLTYTVHFSYDLGMWTASATTPALLTSASAPGDYEVVSVPYPSSVPVTGGGSDRAPQFFRVETSGN